MKPLFDPNNPIVNAEFVTADGSIVGYCPRSFLIERGIPEAEVDKAIATHACHAARKTEYPSIEDQFDLLYHGGYDAWRETIQAVKDKYPKPE